MRLQKTFRWASPFILATALLAGRGGADEGPEPTFTLQLLHISDADGSDTTALNSVASLSGLVHRFRSQYPQQTLLVSSGDNYIPGPRFNAANDTGLTTLLGKPEVGRADIAILNALGVQASAIGNHELDLGTRQFTDLIKPDGAWAGARFPYLAYNTDFSTDTNTSGIRVANGGNAAEQGGKLSGWTKVTVGSQTIGVIGASSPVFANITSPGGLTFAPALTTTEPDVAALAARIQAGVDEMTASGIDKIVLLAHMQTLATEKALAARLRNVDIIVAGGSNTLLSDSNDALRTGDRSAGDYPFLTQDAAGQPTVVVNVDADYKYLGRFMAPFNAQGVLIAQRFDTIRSGAWATSEVDNPEGLTISGTIAQIRDAIRTVLRSKDGNVFGKTEVFLEGRRALVRNALRMRPDRIVIGEVRGGEALDMLQAMNTGHEGSMTTVHANTPRDALSRLENMMAMAGLQLPARIARQQMAAAISVVVQTLRLIDGRRKITSIQEITGMEADVIRLQPIFGFRQVGVAPDGTVLGHFSASGVRPRVMERLQAYGLQLPDSMFDPSHLDSPL